MADARHGNRSLRTYLGIEGLLFLGLDSVLLRQLHNHFIEVRKLAFGGYFVGPNMFVNKVAHLFVELALGGHIDLEFVAELAD